MGQVGLCAAALCGLTLWALPAAPVHATPTLTFEVSRDADTLGPELRSASLLASAVDAGQEDPADLVSAALADYRRLVETLYGNGYYSGQVRIAVNGREAASLSLLSLPTEITDLSVRVDPGPPFRFGAASLAPLAPGGQLPKGFEVGSPARAVLLRQATQTAITGWREAGHAKAALADQRITADHARQSLSAQIRLDPGPLVRFGQLTVTTQSDVRADRLTAIAGLPEGEVFSPAILTKVATRLRRTGTFSSVTLEEGEVAPDGSMDIGLAVADQKPRRYGFGAELSSLEGLDFSAFWMHRNLFGGAERLRVEAEISQLGAQTEDPDSRLGARLDIPAKFGPDTSFFVLGEITAQDELLYRSDQVELGVGVTWFARDGVQAETGLSYLRAQVSTGLGDSDFTLLMLPSWVSWDRRDDPLNPRSGTFLRVEATPFSDRSGSSSGARAYVDARGYRSFGNDRFVLAGRLQLGSVLGTALGETYPGFLFYSGGGGSVRGQPFQSLAVDAGGGAEIGDLSFAGAMLEMRAGITDTLGAVVFSDIGFVSASSGFDGSGDLHAGAGIGVRYDTGIGPLRFDVAGPVAGDTGDGVQIYIGIGQAF